MPSRRFRVRWAEIAVRDLEEIIAFIALNSPANAARVMERIERRSETLESTPERGRVVPELAQFGMRTWRELVVKPYRLIYHTEGHTVTVLSLFDGRRDLEDLLLERLVRSP